MLTIPANLSSRLDCVDRKFQFVDSHFIEVLSLRPIWPQVSTGSDYGFASKYDKPVSYKKVSPFSGPRYGVTREQFHLSSQTENVILLNNYEFRCSWWLHLQDIVVCSCDRLCNFPRHYHKALSEGNNISAEVVVLTAAWLNRHNSTWEFSHICLLYTTLGHTSTTNLRACLRKKITTNGSYLNIDICRAVIPVDR